MSLDEREGGRDFWSKSATLMEESVSRIKRFGTARGLSVEAKKDLNGRKRTGSEF